MTNDEKLTALKTAISPDVESDGVLAHVLSTAAVLILNRMYPFGYADDAVVPTRYEQLQIELAVELYTRRGAEGQTSHSENGISRSWAEKSPILNRIVPRVGSVISNA